jgi:hypothetical protein
MRLQLLYIGGDVVRADGREREAALLAPAEELAARPGIGPARVRVADIRGEEFDIAPAGLVAEVRVIAESSPNRTLRTLE